MGWHGCFYLAFIQLAVFFIIILFHNKKVYKRRRSLLLWKQNKMKKSTALNLSVSIFYKSRLCPWGFLKAAQTPWEDLKDTWSSIWKKKKKAVFPQEFLRNLAVGRCCVFYLSAALCWCVLTVLCVTDGVLCWIHPAEVLGLRVTTWQIEHAVSDRLFFYLWHGVCSNKLFCTLSHSLCVCVCVCVCVFCLSTRPFPSEDTALNEDDVYRSLEELAE